jgi:hypothetical protein
MKRLGLALFGLALIAAGVFVADPMNGFPAGDPLATRRR